MPSGSVTLANTRLSLVSTAPFVDFSAAGTLTPYLNWRITLTDSAGKTAKARILSAGMGETTDTEMVVNGGFEGAYTGGVAPNWTAGRGTPSEYTAAPQAGSSSQQINNPAGNNGYISPAVLPSGTPRALYKHSVYYKALSGTAEIRLENGFVHVKTITPLTSATWANVTTYMTLPAASSNVFAYLYAATNASADANSVVFDANSMAKVLTPSATGVVTSAWTIESGFNYNDSAGYTYRLRPSRRSFSFGFDMEF